MAIAHACAAAGGLLGEGKNFMISEMLMGLTKDLEKKVAAIVSTPEGDGKKEEEKDEPEKTPTDVSYLKG